MTAYPITKIKNFKRALQRIPTHTDILVLSIIFSFIAILGNVFGESIFDGAIVHSGLIGPVVGGIIGGPIVGLISGLVGGLQLYFFVGGFAANAQLIAHVLAGLIAGGFYKYFNHDNLSFFRTFWVAFTAELVNIACIYFGTDSKLFSELYISMLSSISLFVNPIGVGIFVSILKDVQTTNYLIGYNYAQQSLAIVNETLPLLENGFNQNVAEQIAKCIFDLTSFDAIAITDSRNLLALSCEDSFNSEKVDFMALKGKRLKSSSFLKKYFYINNLGGYSFSKSVASFPCSVIAAPLTYNNEKIGYIKAYKIKDIIDPPAVKIITGIADFLSLQVQSILAQEQTELRRKSEYENLKAQINPHFLFNTLSIIKLLIRKDPHEAQDILLKLSSLLRNTLYQTEDLVPLSKEIEIVEIYLSIQKSRFTSRLEVHFDIDDTCRNLLFPTFIIQPIVENAMNHAFQDTSKTMLLCIRASLNDDQLIISIEDNGKGISQEIIDSVEQNTILNNMGIGLTNINRRLSYIFGEDYVFNLNNLHPGTKVEISISNYNLT